MLLCACNTNPVEKSFIIYYLKSLMKVENNIIHVATHVHIHIQREVCSSYVAQTYYTPVEIVRQFMEYT